MGMASTPRVPLIALRSLKYGGVALKAGQAFEASRKDARVLKVIKRAKDGTPAKAETKDVTPAAPATYQTTAVEAEPVPQDAPAETPVAVPDAPTTDAPQPSEPPAPADGGRRYRRKDLTAKP